MNCGIKPVSEEELGRQTQAGSLGAFEELVRRYEHRVYGFVAQHFRNHMDAREVTQDVFVRAFRAIGQFDPRHPFGPWLFSIARRKCIDRLRAAPPSADEPVPEMADTSTPAETLARKDDCSALWDCARRTLPEAQFTALWFRYAEDMDIAQVANVLNKTKTHVKVLLFRARQTLRVHLKPESDSESSCCLVKAAAVRSSASVSGGRPCLPQPQ